MELKERLERIEQLKTDKRMQLLLTGIRSLGEIENLADKLLEKHKAKNPTINSKMKAYRNDLMDEYGFVLDEFVGPATEEIFDFIDEDYEDDYMHGLIFDYSIGDKTLDELIGELKQYVSWSEL